MTIIAWSLLGVLLLVGGLLYANRAELVSINTPVDVDFPQSGFPHDAFESLLKRYVDAEGNVAYERWHNSAADQHLLEQYLAAVAEFSPATTPQRFPSGEDALAYWLYAYNAAVIYSVLLHWPVDSVTDVRAPVEAVKGLGFFYRQRFLFGGEALSLYTVEHDRILKKFRDPRVHFVLNCASESCPVLKPELPTGSELEPLLESSAYEFINDARNVTIDHDGRRIVLSTIFQWYRKDFVNDLRRKGKSAEHGVLDYITGYASPSLATSLNEAAEYTVVFADYDWQLNRGTADEN